MQSIAPDGSRGRTGSKRASTRSPQPGSATDAVPYIAWFKAQPLTDAGAVGVPVEIKMVRGRRRTDASGYWVNIADLDFPTKAWPEYRGKRNKWRILRITGIRLWLPDPACGEISEALAAPKVLQMRGDILRFRAGDLEVSGLWP